MAILDASKRLGKNLSLLDVYAIAAGATLSSGFFLLPGLAAEEAGPAVVLTYFLAAIPLFPGICSTVELATAMPRAGGVYYFLDRSLGPLFGTIGGLGSWLALVLKVCFALVGMGAYIHLFWPDAGKTVIAVVCAVLFGVLNGFGARRTGGFQVFMVAGLLVCLLWFLAKGASHVEPAHFGSFFGHGWRAILSTTGLVCVSYIGLTKIASVAEEVKDPEKVIPRAAFLALVTAVLVYAVGTSIMVGVLEPAVLEAPDLTPVASTGYALGGDWGQRIMIVAAVLAFFAVANAGIMSASRYPLAMSRDHLVPRFLARLGRFGVPTNALVVTVATIVVAIIGLDILSIAKLAGAFQLMLFAFNCLAVIVMRESEIESYDPGYRSPFYPWMHILGIVAPFGIIAVMGWLPVLFTLGVVVVGIVWFVAYAQRRVDRYGAIYHVFERLGRRRFTNLDSELRGIMKEKGLRDEDPFVATVASAHVLDCPPGSTFDDVTHEACRHLAASVSLTAEALARAFLEGTRIGATPIAKGAALPHVRLAGVEAPLMVIARCRKGVQIDVGDVLGDSKTSVRAYAIFFLVSPESDAGQHLRLLAKLASRLDQDQFQDQWLEAADDDAMKEILIRNERYLALTLGRGRRTEPLIDRAVCDMDLPEGCLVAVVQRDRDTIVPGGSTILRSGDRITVIGSEQAVRRCGDRFAEDPPIAG